MHASVRRATWASLAVVITVSSSAAAEDLPSPLPLDALLEAVRAHNPELSERRSRSAAAAARPRGEGWPDDPTLALEWWQQPVDFSTVPIMLSLRQAIPWRSKLRLRREIAEREARTTRDEADDIEVRVLGDARRAYADLAWAERNLALLGTIRPLLENLVQIAGARYRVGSAVQADVLKAQAELLMIENEQLDDERLRDDAKARLNGLLDRPAAAAIGPSVGDSVLSAIPSEPELLARAIERRPEVRRARDALAAAEARRGLAARENLPELAAWAGYMTNNLHGTDTFTVGLQTSLPFFSTVRKRAQVSAADAEVTAARRALDAARRRADVELRAALLQLDTAARHVRLHADKLIPLSELTLQSALASYQAGRIDFPAVLESARAVLQHHTDHLKYLFEYQRRRADVTQIVGDDVEGGAR